MELDINDLINNLPDSQYGIWVKQLFSPQGGNPINFLLSTLNTAYALFAVFYAAFQFGLFPLAMIRTKKIDAGKGLSWGLVRTGLVLALLIPDPRTGLNLLNNFTLVMGSAGYNIAQNGWSKVRDTYFNTDAPVYTNVLPPTDTMVARLLELHVCNMYARIDYGRTDFNAGITYEKLEGDDVRYFVNFNSPGNYFNQGKEKIRYCGAIKTPNLERFAKDEFEWMSSKTKTYEGNLFSALQALSRDVADASLGFVRTTHPRIANANEGVRFDREAFEEEIARAVRDYEASRGRFYEQFIMSLRESRVAERIGSGTEEWIHAGGFWRRISNIGNFQNNIVDNSKVSFISPQWKRIWADPPHHVKAMRSRLSELIHIDDPDMAVSHTSTSFGARVLPGDIGFIEETIVNKVKKALAGWLVESVDFQDPTSSLVSKGYTYLGMYGSIVGVVALISVAFTPAVGMLAWNLLEGVRGWLKFAGILLVVGLPMVPYLLFTFGIISWIMPLIFFFFTGPLWLIPNIRADSSVLIVGNGWTTLIEIALRPIVLLVALALSYGLFIVIGTLIEETLGTALVYAYTSFTGLLVFGVMVGVYAFVMGLVAIACFLMIIILPNQLSQAMPQEGMMNG